MSKLKSILPRTNDITWWKGILLVAAIATASFMITKIAVVEKLGLSNLTIAIMLGIIIGNTVFGTFAKSVSSGVDYSKGILLRAGIILYGFRITFQQIVHVGWVGVIIDIIMVSSVFLIAMYIGPKLFKMDRESSALIGAGAAICGAAAVMATEPILKAPPHKVSVAVATVVIFGTISMFLYPVLFPFLSMSHGQFGVYVGSSVHEVAQVVAAGKAISDTSAATAIIVKMIRVMMLVPFLIILSLTFNRNNSESKKTNFISNIPWFAVFFIIASVINSIGVIPARLSPILNSLSLFLLAMAMAALGLRTHVSALKQAGIKPIAMAFVIFLYLVCGGYLINKLFASFIA